MYVPLKDYRLLLIIATQADKDQRALLYESIRGHIVTLRGCKTGSKVIWLLCVFSLYDLDDDIQVLTSTP